jgi:hypothetical protein
LRRSDQSCDSFVGGPSAISERGLTFEDGVVGDVNFTDRDWRGVFESFKDPAVFAQVFVDPELGTIAWPGDLDMAPEPLYDAAREHPAPHAAARR